jgi:hypothetical protein
MNLFGKELQKRSKKIKPSNYFTGIKEWNYDDFCNGVDNRDLSLITEIADCVFDGKVIILRGAIDASEVSEIITKIHEKGKALRLSDPSARMLDGVNNIHYISTPSQYKSGYRAIDHSYYFFPWNKPYDAIAKIIKKVSIAKVINGYDEKFHENIPSDGIIERLHVIHYPSGGGEISEHFDPHNLSWLNCAIYGTEFGKDYHSGGFFVRDANTKSKIHLDSAVKAGDMIFFFPGMYHGIDPIDPEDEIDYKSKKGRWFFNYNLLESHHVKDRKTAITHKEK